MITNITNSNDALAALNENFAKLVKKERKVLEVREVNNTIGKMTNIVKAQLLQKVLTNDRTPLEWLNPPTKQITNNKK